MKQRTSVQEMRGGNKMDIYYSGVSARILSLAKEPKEEAEKMEKIAKSDSNAGKVNA